jgi:hypothetical protein
MDKSEILVELEYLLNIPQIERLLAHKIAELRNIYKDEIDFYLAIRRQYIENTYKKMYVYEENDEEKKHILSTYRFEIDKCKNNKWTVTEIDPTPQAGKTTDEIFPNFLIHYMASFAINPGRIEVVNNFSHPKLKGKLYNLRFTKYSEYHILGTIAEVKDEIVKKDIPGAESNLVDITDHYKNDNIELNYKELMDYLEKYPAFREHIFSEFFMKWKPLIDWKLLKLDIKS